MKTIFLLRKSKMKLKLKQCALFLLVVPLLSLLWAMSPVYAATETTPLLVPIKYLLLSESAKRGSCPKGLQRIRKFAYWQNTAYLLREQTKVDGLYRWNRDVSDWEVAHSEAVRDLLASDSHAVLIKDNEAFPMLADGSLGKRIELWHVGYEGYSAAIGGRFLYLYRDGVGDLAKINLETGAREYLPKLPNGKPNWMAVDANDDVLVVYKHGPNNWWKYENNYSAKEKIDGGNWDAENNRWIYRKGIYRLHNGTWSDVTANIQCGNMTDRITPGPVKHLSASPDRSMVLVSTEQGVWQWQPAESNWKKMVENWGNTEISIPDQANIFTSPGKQDVFKIWGQGFTEARVIQHPDNWISTTPPILLPDDDTIWTVVRQDEESGAGKCYSHIPHRQEIDADSPVQSYDLKVDFAGIIGESAGNRIVAAEVVAEGLVAVVGTFGGIHQVRYYDNHGQQQGSSVVLDAEPTDADVDAGRLAVATTQGPVLIEADGTPTTLSTPINANSEHCRIDFDGGRVAWLADGTLRVYTDNLELLQERSFDHSYVTDTAIDADREEVAIVGFDNRRNGLPVQLPVARAFSYASGTLVERWHLWKYHPDMLDHDMADSRLYHVLYADNGDCYVAGETAGGNTVFRWNGVDLNSSTLVDNGPYSEPWNTKSEHKLYYGRIDPEAGRLLYGQMCFPRKTDFGGNTFAAKNGALEVTGDGTLYFTGVSAAYIEGRDLNRINGQLVGKYAGGDMTLLMVSPDFKNRLRWTLFNAEDANGSGAALAIADGYAVLAGNIQKGSMIVTDGSVPFSPEEDEVTDAYMAIWDYTQDQ